MPTNAIARIRQVLARYDAGDLTLPQVLHALTLLWQ